MKLRLECYDGERDAAVSAIRSAFSVTKVSKAYPNTRQTGSEGTPCESRYYIEADGTSPGTMALILKDMFRFLGDMVAIYKIDPEPEIAKMRAFSETGPSLPDDKKFELLAEWRSALLGRCAKGGAPHAAGHH